MATLVLTACSTTPRAYDFGSAAWEKATTTPPEVQGMQLGETATLSECLRYAEWNNPASRAAAARWHAALEGVPQAVALPDPRINFAYYLDEVETRTGPMDWRVGISQSFPWFGTLDVAGEAAASRAEAARERFVATRLEVSRQVREAWFEYAYVYAAIEVTRGHLELLSTWEQVARTRYSTGLGQEADVIRAQVELGILEDRVRTLEDLRRPVAARLNAALNRPSAATLPVPEIADGPAVRFDEQRLIEELPMTSPDLLALKHSIEEAVRRVELADKSFYPDYSVGLDYTGIGSARGSGVKGSGDDALAVTAGLSLPIWRESYRAAEAQANAQLTATRFERANLINVQRSELELALYRYRDAERRIGLFRDTLVPKGQESIQTTTVAYQAGDASFLDLVDAERVLLEFQLSAARAQADQAQSLAMIERITGVPLHQEERR
jgi:cobalt-zinc-cadmium efflux system outer membrane protein